MLTTKVGRVLSSANEREIRAALLALVTVLERAGITTESEKAMNLSDKAKALIEVLKQEVPPPQEGEQAAPIDPQVAQNIIDAFNNFAAELAGMGIVEAAQGGEEQPQEGEENPDEQQPDEEISEDDEDMMDEDGKPKRKPPMKSKMAWLPQDKVNYTSDYAGAEHCSSCMWFIEQGINGGRSCHLIATWPQPITDNGHCDRHEMMEMPEPEPMPVEIVEGSASIDEKAQPETTTTSGSILTTIKRVLSRTTIEPDDSPFQVFKHAGKYYWLARHTNNFEDRDKEILSGASHDAYAARVNMGLVDKPELWIWHSKGSGLGIGDIVWTHHPKDYPDLCFVFSLGHFEDDPISIRAAKYLEKNADKVELSHGFTYPTWALKNGVYDTYNTFEISVLPEGMAANPYTSFEEIQAMALTDKQRQWIKETGGDELLARVERAQAEAEKDGETLKALDKRYKDFGDAIEDKGTDTMHVDLKQVLKVVADLMDAQGETDELVTKVTALETALADANKKIVELETTKDKRPRSAARAKETEIEGDSPISEALKQTIADKTINPFWRTEVEEI